VVTRNQGILSFGCEFKSARMTSVPSDSARATKDLEWRDSIATLTTHRRPHYWYETATSHGSVLSGDSHTFQTDIVKRRARVSSIGRFHASLC